MEKSKGTIFPPQQSAQISIACEQVQNAININLAKANEELIHKAEK